MNTEEEGKNRRLWGRILLVIASISAVFGIFFTLVGIFITIIFFTGQPMYGEQLIYVAYGRCFGVALLVIGIPLLILAIWWITRKEV